MSWNVWRLRKLILHKNLTNIDLYWEFALPSTTQLSIFGHFKRLQLNEILSQPTNLANIIWYTPSTPLPLLKNFCHFYGPETTVKNMMYPVVKPSSIKITNALNTLQNLCLFHEVGNDMLELLQRWESLHVHDAARKQSGSLSYFNQK